MRPFRTAMKWPACFIWSSLHLSSCLFSFCSISLLAMSLSLLLCLCTNVPMPVVLPQWQRADVWCHFCKDKRQDRKWSADMQIYTLKYHTYCTVTAVPRCAWVSLCYMQSPSSKFFAQTCIHTDTYISGCAVVAGVTGSPSPQMTNRYNQLSRDPSCCCHSHYSWTNTYIKQSGATGHYTIQTHKLISTTYACTHSHTHIIARTVSTHCRPINTYLISKESSRWPSMAHRPE